MSANPAASATSESAEPARNLLVARDVHKSFGQTEVLKGIDLTVTEGEVVALIGASGSGKTTFVNYILTENHGKKIAVIENEFGQVA